MHHFSALLLQFHPGDETCERDRGSRNVGGRAVIGVATQACVCVCVSHVAVEALQKQLSVCVQHLCGHQILVHGSHDHLETTGRVRRVVNGPFCSKGQHKHELEETRRPLNKAKNNKNNEFKCHLKLD